MSVAFIIDNHKPPHKYHFNVVKEAALNNNKVVVLVSTQTQENISYEQSIKLWDLYKTKLPKNIDIIPFSNKSFFKGTNIDDKNTSQFREAINNRNIDIAETFVPDGFTLIQIFEKLGNTVHENLEKQKFNRLSYYEQYYKQLSPSEFKVKKAEDSIIIENIMVETIDLNELNNQEIKYWALHADLLKLMEKHPEKFNKLLQKLSGERKEALKYFKDILQRKDLNENATYSDHINYKSKIKELTKYMIDQGNIITPLPKVVFKNGNQENAKNFFGKTAYYDPATMTIVLYTEGRHPKDIVRSFAHEMIHHIQNLENRLDNINTTNTQEDDYLNDIEAEANLKGTMTFRNWTDSLNEIGEANITPYKWSEENNDDMVIEVSFETESGLEYNVELQRDFYMGTPVLDVEFAAGMVDPDTGGTMSSKVITNRGELFKVMSTIVDIVKHYVNNTEAQGVIYSPTKKGDETISTNQRNSLYKAFLKKQVPGIKFKQDSNYIVALLPEYEELDERKKAKDPFGLNAYAIELARGLEENK